MASKSSLSARRSSGQESEQARRSRRIGHRSRDSETSPSMKKRSREFYDEKVAEAHRIKPLYDNLKRGGGEYANIRKFVNVYKFSSESEYLEYLHKPLRTIVPGDDETLNTALKKVKREVVPEKSVSKRTSPKRAVSKNIVEKGKAEESKDDDEYLFNNFSKLKPRLARREGYDDNHFFNPDHRQRFEALRERGVMPHRVFDLDYLNSVGIPLKMHLDRCKLDFFVTRKAPIFPELVAYFYSTLTFDNPNSLFYKFGDKMYHLRDDELAHIMGVRFRKFTPIDIQPQEAFAYLTGRENFSRESKAHIAYENFPLKHILMHKVVIECLRPKASSKTDTSRFEAKLMWALLNGYRFSLAHVVILHMYRTVQKTKGQLPYGGLIFDILRHHRLFVPEHLRENQIEVKTGGAEMLLKMGFRKKDGKWFNKSKEIPVEIEQHHTSAKRKKVVATKGKDQRFEETTSSTSHEEDTQSDGTTTPSASPKDQEQIQMETGISEIGEASQQEQEDPNVKEGDLSKTPAEESQRKVDVIAEEHIQIEDEQIAPTSDAAVGTPAHSQGEDLQTAAIEMDDDAEFERQMEAARAMSILDALPPTESISSPVQSEVHLGRVFSTLLKDLRPAQPPAKSADDQPSEKSAEDQPQCAEIQQGCDVGTEPPEEPADSANPLVQIQQDIQNLRAELRDETQEIRAQMQAFEGRVNAKLAALEELVHKTCSLLCAKMDDMDNFTIIRSKKGSTQVEARKDDAEPNLY